MKPRFFLQDGRVMQAAPDTARALHARELYQVFVGPAAREHLDQSVFDLVLSKRPLMLQYTADASSGMIKFQPVWDGNALAQEEATNLAELGYFIRGDRILLIDDGCLQELRTTMRQGGLTVALPLLRKLRSEERLHSSIPELAAQLAVAATSSASPEAFFVRDLYPYQRQGVDWLCFCVQHCIGTILADDMGLGKTAQLIATICDTISRDPSARILIVVPNPLIENWRREFGFFAPSIVPYLHYGSVRSGLAEDLSRHAVVITPYTTLTSDISMISETRYRLAVFDEASMVKNVRSGRSLAALAVSADSKIAATGTPVENSLTDVWTIAELAFPGYLGPLDDFSRRYVGRNAGDSLGRDLGELEENLRQITLRRMKKDVLEQLPDRRDIHFPVSMQAEERAAYEAVVDELRADASVGGRNMLALINRLQQFTSHPFLLAEAIDTSVDALCSASGKFELLLVLLDRIRAAGEKVLVFATYQKMIDIIAGAVATRYDISAGVIDGRTPNSDRQRIIDEFGAAPGFAVLVLHPRTAGMGFNITAATHVIHYSRQWNPALEMQATARAWRNGQSKTVSAYYLYYVATVEEMVDERLRQKQSLSEAVVKVADDKEPDKRLVLDYLERVK